MRNYVIMYHLLNEDTQKNFLIELKKKFPRHRVLDNNGFKYFSFAERELPGVQDTIQEMMDHMSFDYPDYIALFYTRVEDPDIIHRLMLYGKDNRIDKELKNISQTVLETTMADLLEFDFMRSKV